MSSDSAGQRQRAEAIKFCEHWNTTEIRKLEWLWTQARQEALREAVKCLDDHAHEGPDAAYVALYRLAREGGGRGDSQAKGVSTVSRIPGKPVLGS